MMGVAAPIFSASSAAPCFERILQGPEGVPHLLGERSWFEPLELVAVRHGFELLETALAGIELALPLLQAPLEAPIPTCAPRTSHEHGGGCGGGGGDRFLSSEGLARAKIAMWLFLVLVPGAGAGAGANVGAGA